MSQKNDEITKENTNRKRLILIILLILIICTATIVYYVYCQNKNLSYAETEELSLYIENSLKNDAQDILDKIIADSRIYFPEENITFEYGSGKHNVEEDTNIITYYILYNGKKTSLSLDFETVDSFDITKITFKANRAYTTINNSGSISEAFLTDKEKYSSIITCLLLSLPDSIDKDAFKYANLVNLYEELYEKEQINRYGYNISVKGYTSDLIIYTFEKVKFSMN